MTDNISGSENELDSQTNHEAEPAKTNNSDTKFSEADEWKLKYRELESKLQRALAKRGELKDELESIKESKLKESTNVDEIHQSYTEKLEAMKAELQGEKNARREIVLEKEVLSKANKKLTAEGVDYFLLKHKGDLEITEDGGVRVANSALTVDELISGFADKIPGLAVNTVKPGSGTDKASSGTSSGRDYSLKEINEMSREDRKALLAKREDLRTKVFESANLR